MDKNSGGCSDGNGQSKEFWGNSSGLMVILLQLKGFDGA
jgi:hypothetical protein